MSDKSSIDIHISPEQGLLAWPAIPVNSTHRSRFQIEWRCQEPGCGILWIVNGAHPESFGLRVRNGAWQGQFIPDFGS